MRFLRFFFVGIILILIFVLPSKAFAFSGSGNGTSGDPYQITTCSQLHEISNNLTANYLMMNDVDCNGFSFAPIGDTTSNFFTGTLDGGGHKITNLTINSNENGVAIFQTLGTGGLITNIGYESGSLTQQGDTSKMGSFAAVVSGGSITNSYSKASMDGSAANFIAPVMGGLLGQGTSAVVSNSYYSGNIVNSTLNQNNTGGIAGTMSGGSITNSYSTGSITHGQNVGGIAGRFVSSASTSNSFTTMTYVSVSFVAGMVGLMSSGTVSNGYWNDVSGGFMSCYTSGNTGCNRITNNISYFYTITNPPLTSWDFVNTWSTVNNGSSYPVLYWQSPNPTPTPTPTSVPSSNSKGPESLPPNKGTTQTCSTTPSGSPNLFQINTTKNSATTYFSPVGSAQNYQISYGFNSDASQFNALTNQGSSTGVLTYTINNLPTNSNVYFKVFAQNNCGIGAWSNTMQVKTNGEIYYKNFVSQILSIIPQKTTVLGAKTSSTPVSKVTSTKKIIKTHVAKPIIKKIPVVKPKSKVLGIQTKKSCILFVCL
ncbi:MAG TPA: fibronectin type III domain-containing protein [Patescibacteria group bacterium]|nr:fibronectin type III domain-containing protein [Patescibacteria group bacterium]